MGNITGSFRSLDRDTLTALQQAARSGQKIEATEVDAIEQAAGRDGNVSTGERELVAQLREATRDGREVRDLQLAGFDPSNQEVSFDVSFGANNAGTATVETPQNYVANLTRLEPATRTAFLTSMSRSGLSPVEQKQLASVLNRTGTPEQTASLAQTLRSSQPAQIQAFTRQLQALSGPEQAAALEVNHLLRQNPPPANLPDTLRTRMSALPADTSGRPGMASGRALNALGVYLPATNPTAPGSEDASIRLRSTTMGDYVSDYRSPGQQRYIRDMVALGQQQGFQVTVQTDRTTSPDALRRRIVQDMNPTVTGSALDQLVRDSIPALRIVQANLPGNVWAEDNKWITNNGTVVTTPEADSAVVRLNGFAEADIDIRPGTPGSEGHHTASNRHNDKKDLLQDGSTQGAITLRDQHQEAAALASATSRPLRTTRGYNEGGNMLVGTLPNGDSYAVVGRDGLIASTLHLETEYRTNAASVPEYAPANVDAQIARMGLNQPFASLPTETQTLIDQTVTRLQASSDALRDENARRVRRGETPIPDTPETGIDRQRAIQFLARMELTKNIVANDVGVAPNNVVFVAQPEFHIDMHMRPVAPGQVMINDFGANETLLNDALRRATPGSWEAREIQGMLDHNTSIRGMMEPVMRQIEQQLQQGGLQVVRAPGVMEGPMANPGPTAPSSVRHVNFMNAIPTTDPGTNQQRYITNYTSIGPLREAYREFMLAQGVENVEFVGGGGGERSHSASELSLLDSGGLDCRENH